MNEIEFAQAIQRAIDAYGLDPLAGWQLVRDMAQAAVRAIQDEQAADYPRPARAQGSDWAVRVQPSKLPGAERLWHLHAHRGDAVIILDKQTTEMVERFDPGLYWGTR